MDDPDIQAGDIVRILYKVLGNHGEVVDCMFLHGQVLSIDFDFANKYPYEVKFNYNGVSKVNVFDASEVKFYDRPQAPDQSSKVIKVTEGSGYIEWQENWIDDHQY